MKSLPLANIMHHKLRSLLSAVGIGIGVCMLITLSGLAGGSLFEIAERMESVDADLIIVPRGLADDTVTFSGVGLSEKLGDYVVREHADTLDRAVPIFTWSMNIGGAAHRATGLHPRDWDVLTNNAPLRGGRLFDPGGEFAAWIEQRLLAGQAPTAEELAEHGGLELVIDSKLAQAAGLDVGDRVRSNHHEWTIVGVVPAGVITRVFMPLRTAQYLFGTGDITKCTMIFLNLADGADAASARVAVRDDIGQDVIFVSSYRDMLASRWAPMFTYVNIVNAVALTIAFLFTMTTLYTMVLERTRDIAILKSCGAGRAFVVWQILAEALILTAAGLVIGLGLSLLADRAVERFTLLTIDLSLRWMVIATLAALAGAVVSSLYPAWRATRVDMAEVLTYE